MYTHRLVLLFGILLVSLSARTVSSSTMTKKDSATTNEAQAVQQILAALTDAEEKALPDPEMPLRHFRAENVRLVLSRYYLVLLLSCDFGCEIFCPHLPQKKQWISTHFLIPCLLFYSLNAQGDTEKAIKQVKATLAWRKEFQLETLRDCYETRNQENSHDEAAATACDSGDGTESTSATTATTTTSPKEFRDILFTENETGKVYVRGYDTEGRAVVYMRPGLENTGHELNNMRHLVWNMEKAIAISERNHQSKIVFVVDFEGFSLFNTTPMSTAQLTVEIFQKHYPERCHKFFITHPPFVFKAFWSAIKVFVDPTTKRKIMFCSGKSGTAQLREELGGGSHEECAGGENNQNIKPYDRHEYFKLPLDENFDDENWPQFNKKNQQ